MYFYNTIESDNDVMEVESLEEPKKVTTSEAIRAMKILREYFFDDKVALEQFCKLDDTFSRQRCNVMKQTQISDFFPQNEI